MTRRKRDRLAAFRAAQASVAEMNARARDVEPVPVGLTVDYVEQEDRG